MSEETPYLEKHYPHLMEQIEQPYRDQINENFDLELFNKLITVKRTLPASMVFGVFWWDKTPQGTDYWSEYFEELCIRHTYDILVNLKKEDA